MRNLLLSLMVVCFVTVSMAQQKDVVKEIVTKEVKEVKKCDSVGTKECCAKKEGKHAACKDKVAEGHKHENCAKKGDSKCTKECSAKKEGKHAECKDKATDGHKHENCDKKGDIKCTKECCVKKEGMKSDSKCTKSCCADKKVLNVEKEVKKVKDSTKMAFACPMKCEGDKTYEKEGQCPKCNMNLKSGKK